jgi:hypothetical protein
MNNLSLNGDLKREIIIQKICEQSIKDERGRRKSFRITQAQINEAIESKINFIYLFYKKNS